MIRTVQLIGLLGIAVLLPFFYGGKAPFAHGVFWVVIGVLATLEATRILLHREPGIPISLRKLFLQPTSWLFLFFGGLAGSLLLSPAPLLGIPPLADFLAAGILFVLASNILREKRNQEIFFWLLLAASLFLAFAGVWFYLTGKTGFLTSTFFFPGAAAGWFLLVAPMPIGALFVQERPTQKLLLFVLGTIFLSALILTGVRGGLLAGILSGLPLMLFLSRRYSLRRVLSVILVLCILAGGFAVLLKTLKAEPYTPATLVVVDLNTRHRFDFWRGSAEIFLNSPLAGAGPGTFGSIWPQYQRTPEIFTKFPHSNLFELLAETGILGTLPFIGILTALTLPLFLRFAFGTPKAQEQWSPFFPGFFFGFLGLTLHGFLDVDWHFLALFSIFWISAGMLSSAQCPHYPAAPQEHGQNWRHGFAQRMLLAGCIGITGIGLLLLGLKDLRAQILRNHTAAFVELQQWAAAANLASTAGFQSQTAEDFLVAGEWLLRSPALGEEKAHLARQVRDDALRARRINPLSAKSYFLEGRALLRLGESDLAVDRLRTALSRDPLNHPEYAVLLGQTLLSLKKQAEAEEAVDSTLNQYSGTSIMRLVEFARSAVLKANLKLSEPARQLESVAELADIKGTIREVVGDSAEALRWHAYARELRGKLEAMEELEK